MKPSLQALIAASVLSFSSVLAIAEEQHSISANFTLASDYILDGVSQTDSSPATQGGVDYAHSSGAYAGIWASNVDFGDAAREEIDYYVGFSNQISEALGYNTAVYYYQYTNVEHATDYNYFELLFGVSVGDDTGVDFYYSDDEDVWGAPATRVHLWHDVDLGNDYGLGFTFGYDGVENSTDDNFFWRVGVSKAIDIWTVAVDYWDTSTSGDDSTDARLVLSISGAFDIASF